MNRSARALLTSAAVLAASVPLTVVPAVTASAAPNYTICNAAASVGFHPFLDGNYLERHAAGRPLTRVREGHCAEFAPDPGMYLELEGYQSFRITDDLSAPGNSSSYSACIDRGDPEVSTPKRSLKYKGYKYDGCQNT